MVLDGKVTAARGSSESSKDKYAWFRGNYVDNVDNVQKLTRPTRSDQLLEPVRRYLRVPRPLGHSHN